METGLREINYSIESLCHAFHIEILNSFKLLHVTPSRSLATTFGFEIWAQVSCCILEHGCNYCSVDSEYFDS